MRIVILALCCAGCLSTPPPAEDDTFDAMPIDAMPCDRDPRPAQCNLSTDFASEDFPGRPFELRVARVDDINADANADLILASNAPDNQGVYVLLGPIDPAVKPQYHAFIDTDLDIGDLAIRNVVGPSGCPELTVFGPAGGGGSVQIWVYSGEPNVMYDPTALRPKPIDFDPELTDDVGQYLPVSVAWARVRPDGDDLLIADRKHLQVIRIGGDFSANAIASAAIEPIRNLMAPNFDSLNSVQAIPVGDCTLDGVLVTEGTHGHFLEGLVALGTGPEIDSATVLGAVRNDVDGIPPDDVVIAGLDRLAAYILTDDGDALSAVVAARDTGYDPLTDSNHLDGFAVGQLGGSSAPDWVAIDAPDGAGTGVPRAILIEDFTVSMGDPTLLDGSNPRYNNFEAGFIPGAVVIADLSAVVPGNEAWVIASNGDLECLKRRDDGRFMPCLR